VPRISESLLGRQEAALRELLRQFREGRLEEALRRALPLGEPGGRGGTIADNANLPRHNLFFSLRELLGFGKGPGSLWLGGQDVRADLEAEYRKAAEDATRRGDYRRAAFIYGKLLRDYRLAAGVLARGGLHHDAAILYLEKLGDVPAAARSFEAAGEVDRALHLYRQRGEHALAGDLLRRAGEDELALEEYRLAAALLVARHDYLGAGELFLNRAGQLDLAEEYFAAGWAERAQGNPVACLLRLAPLVAHHPSTADLLELVGQADDFFAGPGWEAQAGQFYNELVRLAERAHLADLRDELRDRALLGLAGKLRQRAAEGAPASLVSALLGQAEACRRRWCATPRRLCGPRPAARAPPSCPARGCAGCAPWAGALRRVAPPRARATCFWASLPALRCAGRRAREQWWSCRNTRDRCWRWRPTPTASTCSSCAASG
jgi:hypothetical protein